MIKECQGVIKEFLNEKEKYFTNKQSLKNSIEVSTRYCKHNDFDILFCGSDFVSIELNLSFVDKIDGRNLIRSRKVPTLTENRGFGRYCTPVVYLKGHIYLFDCLYKEFSSIKQVEKYSIVNDSLESVGEIIDDYYGYCACGFIDKVYLIGGYLNDEETATCRYFDTNDNTWGIVASMKEVRSSAACTVFEGRIIVSGGWGVNDELNTVECYDHIADEWSHMPSMITRTSDHSLIAIKNKLFAIGGYHNIVEVYDSNSNKFVAVNSKHLFGYHARSIPLGNKIVIFFMESTTAWCYDVDTDEWSKESFCGTTDDLNHFTKFPKLDF